MARMPIRIAGARVTRRELLKAAQVVGVGAAAGGLALVGREDAPERSASGTCRICTMHCGIVATTRGNKLVRVEGDVASPTKGFLCLHGQALREIVHSHDRLRRPLVRSGKEFREVPWAVALAGIAERLRDVKATWGARALAVQTGWPFVRHPFVGILHRFAQAFGTPNVATVASLCEAAGRMGKALTVGSKYTPDLRRTRTMVVWGANPTYSSPPFAHLIAAKADKGKNLIVVDPVRTELAEAATLHLRVRPGTDGALALAIMNVLVKEELYDRAYVAHETVGFDRLVPLLERYPPDRVASLTTVPADSIVRAARFMATEGPTGVWDGLGVEHHENAVQTVRAISMIEALCGHLDEPGGGQLMVKPRGAFWGEPLPQLYRMATPEPVPEPVAEKPIGYDEHPLYEIYNRQAQANLFARAIADDRPYPLRALILFGANPFVTWPGSEKWKRALDKLELLVVVDPFLSRSAELADYVLPASTFAEAADVDPADRVAVSGLVPEQFESWPDWKVVFRLAEALGIGRFFPWDNLKEALEAKQVPYMKDPAHTLLARPSPGTGAPLPRFPTPSGKIELYSETLERFGYDPLPEWKEPRERPWSVQGSYPLILVSGPRTRPYINSQFRQIPSVASKMPEPLAQMHPTAARTAGVRHGQRVAVVSPRGRIELKLSVTDRVHPETVVIPAGWASANANWLTDHDARDPISGFPAFRSTVCRVEAVASS